MDLDARGRILERLCASGHRRSNCNMQSGAAADLAQVHPGASSEARMEIKALLVSDCGRRPHDQSENSTFHGKSNAGSYSYICRRSCTFTHRTGKGHRGYYCRCTRNTVIADTFKEIRK